MDPFIVDPDKCKNDSLCAKACPARIIKSATVTNIVIVVNTKMTILNIFILSLFKFTIG